MGRPSPRRGVYRPSGLHQRLHRRHGRDAQRLEEFGLAIHRDNVIPEGQKPQPSALNHAQKEPLVAASDWLLVFDADEFLCINHPSGTLEGLLDDTVERGANGVVITWRIFGSGGVTDWSRQPVTEQYTRAAPPLWNKGWGVKTLFRYDPVYWKLGIHRPSIRNKWLETDFPDTVRWLNGSGVPMEDYFKFRGWRSIRRTLGYDWAQMNHYAVKSIDAYAVRQFRGNVNNKKDKYNAEYWALQDRNEVEDRAILRHAERRAAIMAELLADPVLKKLHDAALDRVEARLDDFRKTDDYARLRDGLIEASSVPIAEVEAKPPKARDPEKIAALMSRVERAAQDRDGSANGTAQAGWATPNGDPYLEGGIDLSSALPVDWIDNHGIALPADPRVFAPEALNAVLSGRFERRHARNILGYLSGCDRVLDVGSGMGFVALRALAARPDLVAMACDSRAPLLGYGRDVAARAGVESPGRIEYADCGDAEAALADRVADFRPDVLRIAHESQLPHDRLAALDLSPVRRVLLPFASREQEERLRKGYTRVLAHAGFAECEDRADSGSLQFDRTP
jgi:hypothetical protein